MIRECHYCGTLSRNLREQYMPASSGPGWKRYLCGSCILLPQLPDMIAPTVIKVLARSIQRRNAE